MKHLERFARGLLIGLVVVLALVFFSLLIQAAIHYPFDAMVVAVVCIVAYIVGMALEKAEE